MIPTANHAGHRRQAQARRNFLTGGVALLSTSAVSMLTGCVTPAPEPESFDPSTLVYPPPPETPRFYYDSTLWGSASVVEETAEDRLRRFATGESARGKGFAKPFGIVAQDGRIFVTDTVSRHVHVLDFPRRRYYEIGRKGVGRLAKPLGIALDRAGRVYVVDGTAQRVLVYDLEGNYETAIGTAEDFDRPSGIAVSPDGDRVYVLDTGGVDNSNHRVLVFDGNGRRIGRIGGRGREDGQFNLPLDCALGPDGRLYVLDTGNFRVQVFGADGGFQRSFGEAGRFPGQFGHPRGIALDAEGKVYVSDTSFGVFQIFDDQGRILMSVGERSEAGGPGKFILPAGIAVDVDGRIYMVDQFFRKIELFRPATLPADWPIGQSVA